MSSKVRLIRFSSDARKEFEEAARWYETQRRGLGSQFILALEAKLDTIRKSPEIFPIAHHEYRRAILKRFPFAIFFELVNSDIHILAVYHTSREPNIFADRC